MSTDYKSITDKSFKAILNDKKDDSEFLYKIYNELNCWAESELELSQNRTDFQIEKYIIHDNFTISSAFKAALDNRKSVAEGLLARIIDTKKLFREFHYKWDEKDKTQPIWWKSSEGGEELCWYDIDEFILKRTLEDIKIQYKASVDELEFFDKIINRLIEMNDGKLVTLEQFKDDQPLYWERRLANQCLDEVISAKTGVNPGNIRSTRRAAAPTVLSNDVNRSKNLFGNPKNPQEFLDNLEESVAAGILEVSGMDKDSSYLREKSNRPEFGDTK